MALVEESSLKLTICTMCYYSRNSSLNYLLHAVALFKELSFKNTHSCSEVSMAKFRLILTVARLWHYSQNSGLTSTLIQCVVTHITQHICNKTHSLNVVLFAEFSLKHLPSHL